MNEKALPLFPLGAAGDGEEWQVEDEPAGAAEGMPGGDEPVRWEVIARVSGLTQAAILVGRLQAEGIPARAWQEGAGQALGLTVGLLGTGHVAVPAEYVAQAEALLDEEFEVDEDEEA
jgi:hypothetical protein